MVDIQSPTAENRRGKEEERRRRKIVRQLQNILAIRPTMGGRRTPAINRAIYGIPSVPPPIPYKSSAVAEMGDRLATIGMGRKWGAAAVGDWVSTAWVPINIMWLGPRPYHLTKWHFDPSNRLATTVGMPRSST